MLYNKSRGNYER